MLQREETGKCTFAGRRDTGPSIQGKTHRDNVGKVQLSAGTDDNLQRPHGIAKAKPRGEFGIGT